MLLALGKSSVSVVACRTSHPAVQHAALYAAGTQPQRTESAASKPSLDCKCKVNAKIHSLNCPIPSAPVQDADDVWRSALAGADLAADMDVLIDIKESLEKGAVPSTRMHGMRG